MIGALDAGIALGVMSEEVRGLSFALSYTLATISKTLPILGVMSHTQT